MRKVALLLKSIDLSLFNQAVGLPKTNPVALSYLGILKTPEKSVSH